MKNRVIRRILQAGLILLLCLNSLAIAGEIKTTDSSALLNFADSLFNKGEYYRAITEYKRFIFYYPCDELVKEAKYKIALSYFNGERWLEAISEFQKVNDEYPEDEIGVKAYFKIGESFYRREDYYLAISKFRDFIRKYPEAKLSDEAQYLISWSHLKLYRWEKSAKGFSEVKTDSDFGILSQNLVMEVEKGETLPEKSPVLAGALSTFLPGAGQVYCGRKRDGMAAFILNGIFIWGAVRSFELDNDAVGGLLTFIEVGWYSGNIYNAVSDAHKYNKKVKDDYIQQLGDKYQISLQFAPKIKSPFLCFRYSF